MRVTIQYRCVKCDVIFSDFCTVPDMLPGHSDTCDGVMKYSGCDGTELLYMCSVCGHTQTIHVPDVIPAMASRQHGICGEECKPI